MAPIAETFSLGSPVQIGSIQRELKKIWAEGEGVMTRASLINLAIYSEESESLGKNTQLMSQLTEDHACRAIVIEADRSTGENRVEAWVSAHCHIGRAGSKQVCSEQLSFRLGGPCTALLPSIVFSHLDSDLPFFLWWQAQFRSPMDPQLWSWVDHLIYDSQTFENFTDQMHLVQIARKEAGHRIVLCDLNWTRLDKVRAAVAQFFDHPTSHHHFAKIQEVKITFGRGFRSTAVLLAGWLAAQLKWQAEGHDNGVLRFRNPDKKLLTIQLREAAGEPIEEISLRSGGTVFAVKQFANAPLLEVTRHDSGEQRMNQLMPAGARNHVELLNDELVRGGPHAVYLRVLNCIRDVI